MDQKLQPDKLSLKIKMLEEYIRDNKIEEISVLSYLFDIKELKQNLKISYIYRKYEKEYRKGQNIDRVEDYYKKSLKVFIAARKFIKTYDNYELNNIVDSINKTILHNYEMAFRLFMMEFNI
jgi:hypothetical protein